MDSRQTKVVHYYLPEHNILRLEKIYQCKQKTLIEQTAERVLLQFLHLSDIKGGKKLFIGSFLLSTAKNGSTDLRILHGATPWDREEWTDDFMITAMFLQNK